MTRSEREQLIERYLQEKLTPSEEENFFIEAATDKELRFHLKASRIVESTFRKDREAAPTAYNSVREHLAQLLAASKTGQPEPSAGEGGAVSAGKPQASPKPLGWIVTAASIGLLSIISLVVGITAIDKAEQKGAPPAAVQQSGGRERSGAEPGTPLFSTPGEPPPPTVQPTVPVQNSGEASARAERKNAQRATTVGSPVNEKPQENNQREASVADSSSGTPAYPAWENIIPDTTTTRMRSPIQVDTPQ